MKNEGICVACNIYKPLDRCHIKSKGAGGSMDLNNILMMCRFCHVEQHKTGIGTFAMKNPSVRQAMKMKGLEVVWLFGSWKVRKI